jgi:hypothetical protein
MSRPRRVTDRPVVNVLIAIVCGFCCVLPLFFIASVVGGAEIVLLVAIVGIAASVFMLPTLIRRQKHWND